MKIVRAHEMAKLDLLDKARAIKYMDKHRNSKKNKHEQAVALAKLVSSAKKEKLHMQLLGVHIMILLIHSFDHHCLTCAVHRCCR